MHDDGILIKDKNTEEVPEWCVPYMCKFDAQSELVNPCEQIDWYKKGIINITIRHPKWIYIILLDKYY